MHKDSFKVDQSTIDAKFADLKSILMDDDLSEVHQKIKFLENSLNKKTSEESIRETFDKFLVSSLEERLKESPEKFIDMFKPYLLDMLFASGQSDSLKMKKLSSDLVPMAFESKKNGEDDKVLAERLSPYVGKALKNQIQKEKDTIIDVLYPIIGTLISKFIKKAFVELNEKINLQVESALPFNVIKRRVQSKIYGVSESEILFQERIQGRVKSIYLIHKATGVVISSAHSEESCDGLRESDSMIGGMFSAITSFVNDWIESGQEQAELSEINYGESKIFFETTGNLITAVVTEGKLSYYLKASVQKFMAVLLSEHQSFISEFNGDLETVPADIKDKITAAMSLKNKKEIEVLSSNKKIYFLLGLTLLILALCVIYSY